MVSIQPIVQVLNYLMDQALSMHCNDLRARIKTYCKKENLSQAELAEKMNVTPNQMSRFMTGSSLLGLMFILLVYMKYLKTRMPLSDCSDHDRAQITNTKWGISFG